MKEFLVLHKVSGATYESYATASEVLEMEQNDTLIHKRKLSQAESMEIERYGF